MPIDEQKLTFERLFIAWARQRAPDAAAAAGAGGEVGGVAEENTDEELESYVQLVGALLNLDPGPDARTIFYKKIISDRAWHIYKNLRIDDFKDENTQAYRTKLVQEGISDYEGLMSAIDEGEEGVEELCAIKEWWDDKFPENLVSIYNQNDEPL